MAGEAKLKNITLSCIYITEIYIFEKSVYGELRNK